MPYRPSPDRVPDGSSRAVLSVAGSRPGWLVACRIARRWIASHRVRRVPYRPSSDTASGMGVVCPMAWCRIACRSARRPITSRHIPARVGDLDVCTVVTVRRAEGPSPAMPRPNSACSRRRQPLCTNIYSFAWPWRSLVARSAARLRRGVGRLHNYIARRLNLLLTKCYHFLTVIA